MNLLLDTHTLIWFLEGDTNLSQTAKLVMEHPENTNFVSIASFWEIAIKVSIGKLEMHIPLRNLNQLIVENGIEILPISVEQTILVGRLPFHHRDPFDRLLIAQAINRHLTILTKDEKFPNYDDVQIIW